LEVNKAASEKKRWKGKRCYQPTRKKVKKANNVIQGKTNCDYGLFSESRRQLRRVNECVGWSIFRVGTVNIHSVLNATCDKGCTCWDWHVAFIFFSSIHVLLWYSKFKFFFSQNTIWLYAIHSIPTICLSMAYGPCGFMYGYTPGPLSFPCPLFLLIFIFIIVNNANNYNNISSTEYCNKICIYSYSKVLVPFYIW